MFATIRGYEVEYDEDAEYGQRFISVNGLEYDYLDLKFADSFEDDIEEHIEQGKIDDMQDNIASIREFKQEIDND